MIKFLLSADIDDSVLIDEDELSLIGKTKVKIFLEKTNKWYYDQALELKVSEDDIFVYNPNVDTEDLRDTKCVEVAEHHYLSNAFFALWKKSKDDVYKDKYLIVEKKLSNIISNLSYDRIIGLKPAVLKTQNGWSTIGRKRGEL